MRARQLARCLALTCVAGVLAATQVSAQDGAERDSIGAQALNRSFRIMAPTLSFGLTRGVLNDSAPELHVLGVGTKHEVWGRYQDENRLAVDITFRRDSAVGFGWRATRLAVPESIDLGGMVRTASRLLQLVGQFNDAIVSLGPPNFCERDTLVSDEAGAIFLRSAARWIRGDVVITFGINLNTRDPLPKYEKFAPRFSIGYNAVRGTNTLKDPEPFTRNDPACVLSTTEIQRHAAPLDSATYEAWRRRLQRPIQ